MKASVTKEFNFCAAHRLLGQGKCERLHGHNYKVFVTLYGTINEDGMVLNFHSFDCVDRLIIFLDHELIVHICDPIETDRHAIRWDAQPTAENMAVFFADRVAQALKDARNIKKVKVQVYETDRCSATYKRKI